MSSSKSKIQHTTLPLVIPPANEHKTTMIILHGRGSTAEKFAEPLLNHMVSSDDTKPVITAELFQETSITTTKTFHEHFPNTKFVFPTAPLRRAVVFKRSLTHQWFDNWSLTEPELKQHLQAQGLRETSSYLHKLLKDEIKIIGAKNVILMGLSQGCAASLIAMLLWQGEHIGAVVGMCGYIPFRKGMHDSLEDPNSHDSDSMVGSDDDREDLFERGDEEPASGSRFERAVQWLHEELGISQDGSETGQWFSPLQSIPVFMGHGKEDEKVPCELGRSAADFLENIDVNVNWQEYAGLGHWYSADMLQSVVSFVNGLK